MDAALILLVLAVAGADVGTQPESDARPAPSKRHTSYFAGQSSWSSDTSSPPPAAAPTGGRYQLGATNSGATVTAPPSVVDRTRSAVVESSNALREGVEAGIQAANQQLYQGNEQVIETARNAGQELSNQFQGWAGTAAQQAGITASGATSTLPPSVNTRQQVSNPFSTSPAATSAAPTATTKVRGGIRRHLGPDRTWRQPTRTPRRPSRPPPRWGGQRFEPRAGGRPFIRPRRPGTRCAAIGQRAGGRRAAGPGRSEHGAAAAHDRRWWANFPVTISANQPVDRSVLAQPRQSPPPQQPAAASVNQSWQLGDGKAASQPTQPATIGNRYGTAGISAGSDAAWERSVAASQPPANSPATVLATGQTGQAQGSQPAPTLGIGAFDNIAWPAEPAATPTGSFAQRDAEAAIGPIAGNAATQPGVGPITTTTVGMPQNPATPGLPEAATGQADGMAPTLQTPTGDQVPWMPLLVVSLSLAGSIGANLFLGWSYIDARQKYRTLVQKTANKFRRATAA